MRRPELLPSVRVHEDPDLFREAVNFTAAETKFAPRLIEKDYFFTLLLDYLTSADGAIVFKGGTCLAKVHAGFYRLSEDVDFAIPTAIDASRSKRRAQSDGIKDAVANLQRGLKVFRMVEPLTGANNSTQYVAVVGYASLLSRQEETIKVEVSVREPLLTPVFKGAAQTILLDPISVKPMLSALPIPCISVKEAMAEKLRAALSRREAAIRDFFDIDYAVRRLGLQPQNSAMAELVRQKLAVPGNDPVDISETRLAALRRQVDSQLKPVLREKDFSEFNLERAFSTVVKMAAVLKRRGANF